MLEWENDLLMRAILHACKDQSSHERECMISWMFIDGILVTEEANELLDLFGFPLIA